MNESKPAAFEMVCLLGYWRSSSTRVSLEVISQIFEEILKDSGIRNVHLKRSTQQSFICRPLDCSFSRGVKGDVE